MQLIPGCSIVLIQTSSWDSIQNIVRPEENDGWCVYMWIICEVILDIILKDFSTKTPPKCPFSVISWMLYYFRSCDVIITPTIENIVLNLHCSKRVMCTRNSIWAMNVPRFIPTADYAMKVILGGEVNTNKHSSLGINVTGSFRPNTFQHGWGTQDWYKTEWYWGNI